MPTRLPHAGRCYQTLRGISSISQDELRGHHHPAAEWLHVGVNVQASRDRLGFSTAWIQIEAEFQKIKADIEMLCIYRWV